MSKFILSAFGDEISENLMVQMDTLAKHDINHIEIRSAYGKNISNYTLCEIKEIKKQLDSRNFRISAIGSPIGKIKITDDMAPELEKFKNLLEIAGILEADYIRIFSFFIPEGQDTSIYRDEVLARYTKYLEIAKGSRITLLHENEKDIYGDTPERCLDLLKTLNCPYLFATFDPANFIQCGIQAFPHAFDLLRPYIKYIHIKDALMASGEVVPAGAGDGKIKEVISRLKNTGYEGFLSLEPHLADFKGFSELENGNKVSNVKLDGVQAFGLAINALNKILSEV